MAWFFNILQAGRSLEPSRTSTMELFIEKRERILAVSYFCKKAPPHTLDLFLDTPLQLHTDIFQEYF